MAIERKNRYTDGLVDLAAGQISREIFVNEEIYQEEQERVFTRAWLFVGHESQIPKPGDYFVSGMGEESVILCRDREEQVHVFLNSCRHRGMKVCRYDEGNTPVFTCPYHGWSYANEQGLGFEVENYEWEGLRLPGMVMDITEARSSEHNLRNFYRRWAEFMDAEGWEDLATWRRLDPRGP
jgi:nitrite reductase/ring-hydroxylating ferredoxin subunit